MQPEKLYGGNKKGVRTIFPVPCRTMPLKTGRENSSDPFFEQCAAGRRRFLAQLTSLAAVSALGPAAAAPAAEAKQAAAPLPTVQLGTYRITRLVAGSNPINGYSYLGPHVDRHMKEYFTPERAADFLLDCQRAGITAHQYSRTPRNAESLRLAREKGSTLHFLGLHSSRKELQEFVRNTKPIAVAHHGGVTDTLFSQGKSQEVHDYVKAVHDLGLLAGVSAHNPDCIKQIADEGWENDYFMTCFYFLTRHQVSAAKGKEVTEPLLEVSHPFYREDPLAMTAVVRQLDKPCFGFKILGAGRLCASQNMVGEAFHFAFTHIKPIDGVIVGMFPRFFDEITANAEYARQWGKIS